MPFRPHVLFSLSQPNASHDMAAKEKLFDRDRDKDGPSFRTWGTFQQKRREKSLFGLGLLRGYGQLESAPTSLPVKHVT